MNSVAHSPAQDPAAALRDGPDTGPDEGAAVNQERSPDPVIYCTDIIE